MEVSFPQFHNSISILQEEGQSKHNSKYLVTGSVFIAVTMGMLALQENRKPAEGVYTFK